MQINNSKKKAIFNGLLVLALIGLFCIWQNNNDFKWHDELIKIFIDIERDIDYILISGLVI